MADLATELLRTVTRAFYGTDHILVVDALINHSTLQDTDLAMLLGMQSKGLRKLCGRLREDGLLSVQSRAERRADGSGGYHGGIPQAGKERVVHRDWYYLNYHRAIDSIKYRMYKLNKHVEGQGMPTTEKKDLQCKRCKSKYTELEVMDRVDYESGNFMCARCGFDLEPVEEDENANENESMKKLNLQLEKLLNLMQKIDATDVPENDFATALSKQKPVERPDANPGAKMEIVDLPNRNLESTKGLEIKPEKIAVQVQDDADVKRENAAAEAAARREREARQNALPDWIAKSTVSGDITAVGAKEERLRREREAHTGVSKDDDGEPKKTSTGDEDVMAAYWEELARAREKEAAEQREEDEEDDDDDDDEDVDFEDVDVTGAGSNSSGPNGLINGRTGNNNTAADEREAKRIKSDDAKISATNGNSKEPIVAERAAAVDTPAASDEDDEDGLDFEDV